MSNHRCVPLATLRPQPCSRSKMGMLLAREGTGHLPSPGLGKGNVPLAEQSSGHEEAQALRLAL